MKFLMEYDLGDGPVRTWVGVQAQVGWELRTHKAIGSMGEEISVTAMVGLLMEQLRIDGHLPDGVVNETGLSKRLADLNMIDPNEAAVVSQEEAMLDFPLDPVPSPTGA